MADPGLVMSESCSMHSQFSDDRTIVLVFRLVNRQMGLEARFNLCSESIKRRKNSCKPDDCCNFRQSQCQKIGNTPRQHRETHHCTYIHTAWIISGFTIGTKLSPTGSYNSQQTTYPNPQIWQQDSRSSADICAAAFPLDAMQTRSDIVSTAPNAYNSIY